MEAPRDPLAPGPLPWRLFLALAGASLLAHLLVVFGTELVPDEAYYALWARELAWDYPDHPPGIAGLLALSGALLGEGRLGVRGPALLTALLVPGLLAAAVARSRGTAEARRLLWILHATLLLHALGVITTPDTPLTLAWGVALAGLLLLFGPGEPPRPGWPPRLLLLGIGCLIGLALLSKLTGWALLGGVAGAGLFHPRVRHRLGGWGGLALLLGPALLIALPWLLTVAAGPADSDLAFQLARLSRRGSPAGNLLSYLGSQAALLSPLLFLLALAWIRRALRAPDESAAGGGGRDPRDLLLLWLCLPLLLGFALVALLRPVEANWVGPGWLAALVGVASLRLSPRVRAWSLGVGLVLVLGLHGLALSAGAGLGGERLKQGPLGRLSGWSALVAEVEAACPEGVIRVRGYGVGAQLGLRLGAERIRVETPDRASAFQRWEQPTFEAVDGACELHHCRQPTAALAGCVWRILPRASAAGQARLCLSRLSCPPPPDPDEAG